MTVPSPPFDLQYLKQNLENIKDVGGNAYMADCPVPSPLPHSVAFGENGTGLKLICFGEEKHSSEKIVDAITGVGLPVLQTKRAEDWHPFPNHAIPKALLKLAAEAAVEGGYPPEFVIVPGLAVLAAACGASHVVKFSTTWTEYPILWTAIVASPGAGKSPALSLVTEALRIHDNQIWEAWKRETEDMDAKEQKPILKRTLCSNITMEKQIELLAENPRGLLRCVDEVSEVVGGLNQYKSGKGSDRPQLLSMWSGDRMSRDRIKSSGPVIVDHPVCSIAGGMQPSKVKDFLSGDDGMAERWLIAHFTEVEADKPGQDANPTSIELWNALVSSILHFREHETEPFICSLSDEGRVTWEAFRERNRQRYNKTAYDPMKSYWRKLNRHAGRLITTLHVAEALEALTPAERLVSSETVEHGIHIAEWFAHQYQSNLPREENLMESPSLAHKDNAVAKLREYIIRKGGTVTRKNIQADHVAGCRTPEKVNELIRWYSDVYPEDVMGNNTFQIQAM